MYIYIYISTQLLHSVPQTEGFMGIPVAQPVVKNITHHENRRLCETTLGILSGVLTDLLDTLSLSETEVFVNGEIQQIVVQPRFPPPFAAFYWHRSPVPYRFLFSADGLVFISREWKGKRKKSSQAKERPDKRHLLFSSNYFRGVFATMFSRIISSRKLSILWSHLNISTHSMRWVTVTPLMHFSSVLHTK